LVGIEIFFEILSVYRIGGDTVRTVIILMASGSILLGLISVGIDVAQGQGAAKAMLAFPAMAALIWYHWRWS
jgi:hypothetical protein